MQEKSTRNKYLEMIMLIGSAALTVFYLKVGWSVEDQWLKMATGVLLYNFPLMLVTRLYGVRRGIGSFCISLCCVAVLFWDGGILMVYPLVSVLICAWLVQKQYFDTIGRVLAAAILSAVPMGILFWGLQWVVLCLDGGQIGENGLFHALMFTIPQFLVAYILIYEIGQVFLQKGYIPKPEQGVEEKYIKGSVRTRMNAFLIGEMFLLVVAGILITNALLPQAVALEWGSREYGTAGNGAFVPKLLLDQQTVLETQVSAWTLFDLSLALWLFQIFVPLMFFADWVFQRNVTTPVKVMTYGLGSYLETLEEDRREAMVRLQELVVDTGDELEALHRTMQDTLKKTDEYVERKEERQKAWEERMRRQTVQEAKAETLAGVAQELRAPVEQVLTLDEQLLQSDSGKERQEYALGIQGAGNQLLAYATDLLDVSRLETGTLKIETREYPLARLIRKLVSEGISLAQEKRLGFQVEVDDQLPSELYGDSLRIQQALENLLSNAVKYTSDGAVWFQVGGFVEGDLVCLRFEVGDTGKGMKQLDLQELCQDYEPQREKRSRNVEGTGIGLYITQQLLQMMGSKLEVESIYGKGSRFYFELWQKITDDRPIGAIEEELREEIDAVLGMEARAESEEAENEKEFTIDDLPQIEGVDWSIAWMHLPQKELLEEVISDFVAQNSEQAKILEECYDLIPWDDSVERYYKQITVMRSAANQLGILPLAGVAEILEGSARRQELSMVWSLNAIFLELWRSYEGKLRVLFADEEEETGASRDGQEA